jgi:hypothetical protein
MLATAPAALPGSPMNAVSLPRLRVGKAASQIFRSWQGAALSALPGLPLPIPKPLAFLTQLGPFSLVHIE